MKKHIIKSFIRLMLLIALSILSIQFLLVPVSRLQIETSFLTIEVILIVLGLSLIGFLMSFLSIKKAHVISDWITFFALSFISVMFVFSFFILPSNVNQSSMFPSLSSGNRILIYHFQYEIEKNDIVVIEMRGSIYPNIPSASFVNSDDLSVNDFVYYVKRSFGLTGDVLTFERVSFGSENFIVFINDVQLFSITNIAYTLNYQQKLFIESQMEDNVIPENMSFVLGDNALSSLDSRAFGLVRNEDIMGKVIYKLWPLGGVS